MSEENRTVEEYLERYASQYTGGDVEEAKSHAIVKAVCEALEQ